MSVRFRLAAGAAVLALLGPGLAPASAQVRRGATVDAPAAAVSAAVAHVRGAAGFAAGASEFVASGGHVSGPLTVVYVQQQVGGIDVDRAVTSVGLDRAGRVVHAAGDVVAAPASLRGAAPGVSAAQALGRLAGHVGARALTTPVGAEATPERRTTFAPAEAGAAAPTARLVYTTPTGFPDGGALRLAWAVELDVPSTSNHWRALVDAQTGAVLQVSDHVVSCSFGAPGGESAAAHAAHTHAAHTSAGATGRPLVLASDALADPLAGLAASLGALSGSYRVYAAPVETPNHTSPLPPADARTLVASPADAQASPFGWHDTNGAAGAEFTITRGNNTWANIDRDGVDGPDPTGAPDGGAALLFNPPLDLTQAPTAYSQAATVNLFYWTNLFHDILWHYGFDEVAGNFQQNNYGRGGTEGDPIRAEAQDSGGTNNANFNTALARMQMFLWTFTTPGRDGDFSNDIIAHEIGHGVSTRLVGGPANLSCLNNAEQMGEGWSDFYGLLLTMRATDTRAQRRGIGTYVLGEPITGNGIRGTVGGQPAALAAPYSTDFAINTLTYGSTVTAGQPGGLTVPHGVGFAWMTILWDVTWDLVDQLGFSPDFHNAAGTAGNQVMMNLVTEGLKLTPCNPGFVQGRDAILAADAALYPDPANPGRGLHYATLWGGFARRGLGFSASQGSTTSNSDNVEAFDAPLAPGSAQIAAANLSALTAPGATATRPVQLTNLAPAGSPNLTYTASLRDLTFVPQRAAAAPAPSGTVAVHGTKALGAALAAPPAAAQRGAGGPDAGGYAWDDSDEPGGPVFAWTSIAGAGTAVTLGDDVTSAAIPLPFPFPFYGGSKTSVRIVSNGFLNFGASSTELDNASIPTAAQPNDLVAALWDDLHPAVAGYGSTVHYLAAADRFVVQFTNVPTYADRGTAGRGNTFQILLFPSGEIRYQYQQINAVALSATIGIENAAGTIGTQVAHNAAYAAPGKAVRFRRGRAWASVVDGAGTVAPGTQRSFSVAFDATGLTEGTYTAELAVTTNDPAAPETTFPVSLTVGGTGTVSGGPGWRLLAAPATGLTVADLASRNLVQGIPGYYPPPQAQPNLFTGYTGSAFTPPASGAAALAPGRGFFWYLYNQNLTPGGPSNSVALPMTLATTNAPVTANTPVSLHAAGDRFNLLGNPFGVSLDVSGVSSWPGAGGLQSNIVQMWDAAGGTYEPSTILPTIAPWQGFVAEAATASTLTIPASARAVGGVLQRAEATPLVAFELAAEGGPLRDRAAVLTFAEGGLDGPDAGDASKLAPMAEAFVQAAFEGADDDGRALLRAVENRALPAEGVLEVPLHVASVGAGAALVLTWPRVEALPADWTLALVDRETGAVTDLREAQSYAFTVAAEGARVSAPAAARAEKTTSARFAVVVGPGRLTAGEGSGAALALALDAPRPNPATAESRVGFTLPAAGDVRVVLVDLLGREVAVVAEGERAAGRHEARVDTRALAPGVYVVRLATGGQALARRLVVAR